VADAVRGELGIERGGWNVNEGERLVMGVGRWGEGVVYVMMGRGTGTWSQVQ
jgi:hypothetical protein